MKPLSQLISITAGMDIGGGRQLRGLPALDESGFDVNIPSVANHEGCLDWDSEELQARAKEAANVWIGFAEAVCERPESQFGHKQVEAQTGRVEFAERVWLAVGGGAGQESRAHGEQFPPPGSGVGGGGPTSSNVL